MNLPLARSQHHPLPSGSSLHSPGSQFRYRIIGPCCRLYDREKLPWPCCRIQWHSKEPSWRRIGPRFIPDMAAKRYPSYSVELMGYAETHAPIILTLYTSRLSPQVQDWWFSRKQPLIASPKDLSKETTQGQTLGAQLSPSVNPAKNR
jgi:hypothetical protein